MGTQAEKKGGKLFENDFVVSSKIACDFFGISRETLSSWAGKGAPKEASTVTAGLMVAVYGESREAWRDLLNLMEHIRQRLLTKRTIGERHRLILPINWEIPEVQPYPFWHGYGTLEYTIGQPQEGLPPECQEITEEEIERERRQNENTGERHSGL